tara:strand:+ start:291 stop:482 length:192 start_codon:yes stop_codon:yes gene_type:complete
MTCGDLVKITNRDGASSFLVGIYIRKNSQGAPQHGDGFPGAEFFVHGSFMTLSPLWYDFVVID